MRVLVLEDFLIRKEYINYINLARGINLALGKLIRII